MQISHSTAILETTPSYGTARDNNVSLSLCIVESEHIAAGSSCTKLVWMKLNWICVNRSAINISKNHVQSSKINHIDICAHLIRDLVEQGLIVMIM